MASILLYFVRLMLGSSESPDQKKMAPYITPVRVEKRQNRAQRPAFVFQELLKKGFSTGSLVINEVVK
jgi:hypothetical protein